MPLTPLPRLQSKIACDGIAQHFIRPFAEGVEARIPPQPLQVTLRCVAGTRQDLHAGISHITQRLGGDDLGLRGLTPAGRASADELRKVPHHQPRQIDAHAHIREAMRDGLELPDGPPELHATPGVGQGDLQRRLRRTSHGRRHGGARIVQRGHEMREAAAFLAEQRIGRHLAARDAHQVEGAKAEMIGQRREVLRHAAGLRAGFWPGEAHAPAAPIAGYGAEAGDDQGGRWDATTPPSRPNRRCR